MFRIVLAPYLPGSALPFLGPAPCQRILDHPNSGKAWQKP
jgi:hypothetical protein